MMFRVAAVWLLMLAHCIGPGSRAYLVLLQDDHRPGLIFRAGLNASGWSYEWSDEVSPSVTRRFFHLDAEDGAVRLKRILTDCAVWRLGVEARRRQHHHSMSSGVFQARIPLTIGRQSCGNKVASRQKEQDATELLVVVPHANDDRQFNEVCLRKSELVVSSLPAYIPESIRRRCRADQWAVQIAGDQLAVEASGVDLVSRATHCLPGRAVKTRVGFRSNCSRDEVLQVMDIVMRLDRPSFTRHHHRRRRAGQQSDSSPASFSFDQPLYLTSVPEERDRGTFCPTDHHARKP